MCFKQIKRFFTFLYGSFKEFLFFFANFKHFFFFLFGNFKRFKLLFIFFLFNVVLLTLDIYTDITVAIEMREDVNKNLIVKEFQDLLNVVIPLATITPFCGALLLSLPKLIKIIFEKEKCSKIKKLLKSLLWELPGLNIFRKLRYFFELWFMDTDNPFNYIHMKKVKHDAAIISFYEAFLESAPQFIFQFISGMYNLLFELDELRCDASNEWDRTKFLSRSSFRSMIISMISLTLSSAKLFYYQRVGVYSDIVPDFLLLIGVVPLILLYNIFNVLMWYFNSFYSRAYFIYEIMFNGLGFLVVHIIFSFFKREEIFHSGQKNTKTTIFWSAVTSWVSPFSIWSNNPFQRSYLFIFVHISSIILRISSAAFFIHTFSKQITSYSNREFSLSEGLLPVLYFNSPLIIFIPFIFYLGNYHSLYNFGMWVKRICRYLGCCFVLAQLKSTWDNFIIPTFVIALEKLFFMCFSISFKETKFGTFFFKIFSFLNNFLSNLPRSFIHRSMIYDYLKAPEMFEEDTKYPKFFTMYISDPNKINDPDDLNGDTVMHYAVQFKQFEVLEEMLHAGGNPFLFNKEGVSVASLVSQLNDDVPQTLSIHSYIQSMEIGPGGPQNSVDKREGLLFQAIRRNKLKTVKLMIFLGAGLKTLNWKRQTPVDVAIEEGNHEMVIFLASKLKKGFKNKTNGKKCFDFIANNSELMTDDLKLKYKNVFTNYSNIQNTKTPYEIFI